MSRELKFDARNFVNGLETAREILAENNAIFRGEYIIHDIIFKSKDSSQGIEKVFLRLRNVPKNIWSDKQFVVVIKQTQALEIGKQSIIPIKKEFDTKDEAQKFIEDNYSDEFEYLFEFDRIGWQYDLGQDQVDLEDIEGHYSIEFKSTTEEGLRNLLNLFNAQNLITGPSVVAIRGILKG